MATINNNVGLVILAGVSHVGEKSLAPSGTLRDGEMDREMGYWKGNYYKATKNKFSDAQGQFFTLEGSGVSGGSPVIILPGSGIVQAEDDECSSHNSNWEWSDPPGEWGEITGGACELFEGCQGTEPISDTTGYADGVTEFGGCIPSYTAIQYTLRGGYARWEEAGELKCKVGKNYIPQRSLYISKDAYFNIGSGIGICQDYTVYAKILPSGEPTDSLIIAQHKNDPANLILGCDYDGRYYLRSDGDVNGVNTAYYAKSSKRFDSYHFPVHLIGTYGTRGTGTGSTLRIYVNGNLEGESESFVRDTSSCRHTSALMGKRNVPYLERGFRGWIDEIAIMGSGLSSPAIKKFYDSIYRLGNFVEELGNPGAKATATITFVGNNVVVTDTTITIIDSAGVSITYTAKGSADFGENEFAASYETAAGAAVSLRLAILHADGHNGSIAVVDDGGGRLHLTQGTVGSVGNTTITSNLTDVVVSSFASGGAGAFDGQAFGGANNNWPTHELGIGAFNALDTEHAQLTIESGVDNTKVKGGAFALYNYNKSSGDCTGLVRTATKNAVSSVLTFKLVDPPTNFFQLTGLSVDVWVENSTNHPSGADLYASISDSSLGFPSGNNVNWNAGYKYVPSGGTQKLTFSASMDEEIYGKTSASFRPSFSSHNLNFTVVYPKADYPYDAEFKIYSTRVKYSSFEIFSSKNTSLSGPRLFTKGTIALPASGNMPLFLDADTAAGSMNLFLQRETSSGLGETGAALMIGDGSVVLKDDHRAVATITFTGPASTDQTITIIDGNGISITYTAKGSADYGENEFATVYETAAKSAEELKLAIEHANGHNGTIIVADDGAGKLTLIQQVVGLSGNTTITENLTNVTAVSFTGGQVPQRQMNLFTKGGTLDTNMRLYVRTPEVRYMINPNFQLFVHGAIVSYPYLFGKTDLYISGPRGAGTPNANMILAMPNVGIGRKSNRRLLFVEGRQPTASLNLFIHEGTQIVSNSIPFFMPVPQERSFSRNMNLYLNQRDLAGVGKVIGLPGVTTNDNMNLFVYGKRLFGSLTESKGIATVTFSGAASTDETITIVDSADTSITYTAKGSQDEGENEFATVYETAAASAANLKLTIEHADGHNGTITVIDNGAGQLTLTQASTGVDTTVVSSLTNVTVSGFTGGSPQSLNLSMPNTIGTFPSGVLNLDIRGHY